MAKTLRVFQVAKELGVQSKDIVAKCQDESIPGITNHMSTVSIGLAATIREWFAAGEGGVATATAVEIAAPVDVDEARRKAQRKARRKAAPKKAASPAEDEAKDEAVDSELAPAVTAVQPPAAEPESAAAIEAPAAATAADAEPTAGESDLIEDDGQLSVLEPAVAETVASSDEDEDETDGRRRPQRGGRVAPPPRRPAQPNQPTRPDIIKPSGERLNKPEEAKLTGPKVIRIEQAEDVSRPGPRRSPGPRQPVGGRGVGTAGPSTGGGPAPAQPGDRRGDTGSRGRNKRRTASSRDEGAGRTGRQAVGGGERGANWRQQDLLEREQRLNRSGGFFKAHRRDNLKRSVTGHRATMAAQAGGKVKVEAPVTYKSLSAITGVRVNDMVRLMIRLGKVDQDDRRDISSDEILDNETATELMLNFDIELDIVELITAEDQIKDQFRDRTLVNEQSRSPVVTILGHVDHGKTTLLDRIRNANVAEGEAGGITQATSAFQVPVQLGDEKRMITFIDTPGHEAFTEMRSRGAKITDVVVLVVAADDGVMPQTIESINHAKAAAVPIIVALNKVDKPEATQENVQRILGQLAEQGLNPVEWGGQTEVVRLSALKGEGVRDLLEVLDYQAQLLELSADFGGAAQGSVIEAQLEEGRGPVARILVQQGMLKKGDVIVIGRAYGRVRDIVNDHGKRIDKAGPSMPVAISGINEVPDAGNSFYIVKNIREAEAAAQERITQERERNLATEKVTLDNVLDRIRESGRKDLSLIVKGDVQGSIETLRASLSKIRNDEVEVVIKHAAVGPINESDVGLAEASSAIIVGFNVTATSKARRMAETRGVDIRYYDVIYDLTDDVTKAAEGLLEPEVRLEVLGHADVREVFKVSKVGMVAGCYVTNGTIERNALVRVTRDGIVVEKDRKLEQLKRFKDDAREVKAGQECGMKIQGYDDIKVGDVLECYKTREVRRSLTES